MIKFIRLLSAIGILASFTGVANAETFESVDKAHPIRIERNRSDIIDITSAELSKSAARCDYVYHVTDKNYYVLGGCNASYTGANAPNAQQVVTAHGRIKLRLIN